MWFNVYFVVVDEKGFGSVKSKVRWKSLKFALAMFTDAVAWSIQNDDTAVLHGPWTMEGLWYVSCWGCVHQLVWGLYITGNLGPTMRRLQGDFVARAYLMNPKKHFNWPQNRPRFFIVCLRRRRLFESSRWGGIDGYNNNSYDSEVIKHMDHFRKLQPHCHFTATLHAILRQ